MDLGFLLAGHEIIWANDFDEQARNTYIKNISKYHSHEYVLDDIENYLNIEEDEINKLIPDADILIGGFPCQGFSIANLNRSMKDERNHLYLQILKVLRIKKPNFFVLENVKGLENMDSGRVLEMILRDLSQPKENLKYNVRYNILNSLDYGVPQNRERIIIFGARDTTGFEIPEKIFDKKNKLKSLYIRPTHSINGNAKDNLPAYKKVEILYDNWKKGISNENKIFIEDGELKSYTTLKDSIYDLPKVFKKDYKIKNHDGSKSKLYPKYDKRSNYVGNRPTSWDKHAPTIMGRGSGTGGPLIPPHPNHERRFSVRETARIQSFPDNYVFYGSNSAQYRQIGNAVPVLMAYNIANILPLKW